MNSAAFEAIRSQGVRKGDVLSVARVAGIMAAKRTAELIPGADLLVRCKSGRRLPMRGRHDDGSHLSQLGSLTIRVIDAEITIIAGGERILSKLHKHKGDMFNHRPALTPRDWGYMLYRAVRAK